jgi:UDP-GlcNAc:undecaprenyl-phosphate GlcNAc-1-phosphate transferase
MTRRLRAKRSPFSADRDHLHHYILKWFSWRRGLLLYLGFIGVPNLIAVLYPQAVASMVLLTIFFYAFLVLTLGREPVQETHSTA